LQVRAKAVKCIGSTAEVDPRVLGMPEVQRGVATALQVRGRALGARCYGPGTLRASLSPQALEARHCGHTLFSQQRRAAPPRLQDDGVSVREAAVELLAKHIVSDPGLAEDYFEVLREASAVSSGTAQGKRGRAGVQGEQELPRSRLSAHAHTAAPATRRHPLPGRRRVGPQARGARAVGLLRALPRLLAPYRRGRRHPGQVWGLCWRGAGPLG
jgi:hypothetical protein